MHTPHLRVPLFYKTIIFSSWDTVVFFIGYANSFLRPMLYRLFAFLQLVSHIPYPAHVSLCSSLPVISCFHRMHVSLSFYLSFSTSLYHNHFGHDITHVSERYYRFWSFDASSLIDPDPESVPDGLRLPWTILHTEAWWLTVSLSCLDSQQELEFVKCIPI